MFESAEIGHKLGKAEYEREEPKLRQSLLALQYKLIESAKFPVIIVVNGVDGAGKGETVNLFNEWMDPRHIQHARLRHAHRIRARAPDMWRFWQVLPPKGKIGILFGPGTPTRSSPGRSATKSAASSSAARPHPPFRAHALRRGRAHPQALVPPLEEGAEEAAHGAFLEQEDRVARGAPRLGAVQALRQVRRRERGRGRPHEHGRSPWEIIEGKPTTIPLAHRGRLLEARLKQYLKGKRPAPARPAPPSAPPLDGRSLLGSFDYTRKVAKDAYKKKLDKLQARLNGLTRDKKMAKRSIVMVFEGMDAAGKGSTIRRLTQAMDARYYRVVPVAAPTEEERAQPYLWRFWRHIPPAGHAVIFDRSWYGRVLVERVEGFCTEQDWMRGYHEINDFEEQLTEAGAIVAKFWLAITPKEQLKRFKLRQDTTYKRYKITDEDWRNRKKWPGLRARRGGHDRAHVDRSRAVEGRGFRRQALLAPRSDRVALRAHRGKPLADRELDAVAAEEVGVLRRRGEVVHEDHAEAALRCGSARSTSRSLAILGNGLKGGARSS
jgi:polyphosphate kinase 2 (PPK2 family)